MLYIDAEACIDCQACTSECPVSAIFQDIDVPDDLKGFIELNAELAPKCPSITSKRPGI
jgi:ferredoxin